MALFTGVVGELSSQLSEYTPVAPATSAMVASLGALALGSVRAQAQQVAPLPSPRLPSPPLALPRLASPRLASPRLASLGDCSAPSAHTSWPPRWVQGAPPHTRERSPGR